jgi:hypothetical protein
LFTGIFGETLGGGRGENITNTGFVRIRTDFTLDSRAGRREHGSRLQALPLSEALASERGVRRQRLSARKEKQMNAVRLFGLEVFSPCEIKAMSIALDEVCGKLGLAGDNQAEREALAKRIVALARSGELDPANLRDGVLREVAVRAWRGMSHSDIASPR